MIDDRTILLTGGGGFIGTALARRLVKTNRVIVFDSGHRDSIGSSGLLGHPNLRIIKGDVMDAAAVRDAMRGCQIVVHLAAIAGVDTVRRIPVTTMKVSLIGTYNVLEAALAEGTIERLVDFSTSEVFGTFAFKLSEGDATAVGAVGEARWTYAVSKLATEHLAYTYHLQYGLPTVSVRPFNIYGPGQVGEGAIDRFIVRALSEEALEIHNDGSQVRAWCYVDDIVDAVLRCLECPDAIGQAFNVGNPRSVCTIFDLARHIVRAAGSRSEVRFVEWPNADVELRIPNITKARKLLGFEPKVDLDEGLARTIEWYRDRANHLR